MIESRAYSGDDTLRPITPDLWDWWNLLGDAVLLGAHFFVGILLIIFIELDLFACLRKISFRSIPPEDTSIKLDEDVVAEEQRVN